jgi:hypothetical protein
MVLGKRAATAALAVIALTEAVTRGDFLVALVLARIVGGEATAE